MDPPQYSQPIQNKGGETDVLPSTSSPQPRVVFASILMDQSDRLCLLRFPSIHIKSVHHAICASWPRGVQETHDCSGGYVFKLRGNPWSGRGDEAIFARRMMSKILETLANIGWVLAVTTYISKWTSDKDTLIFRYQQSPPPPAAWMSISFNQSDRIRLIDAPDELIQYLTSYLNRVIQRHNRLKQEGTYEVQFRGYPWSVLVTVFRPLLLELLEALDVNGWTVYASIEQETPGSDPDTVSHTLNTTALVS
jgi:hypothetical protein